MIKNTLIIIGITFLSVWVLATPNTGYADYILGTTASTTPIQEGGPAVVVAGAYRLAFLVVGLICFGILLFAAALAGTAFGNPSKLNAARDWAFSAISGLVFLLFAVFIFRGTNPDLEKLQNIPLSQLPAQSTGGSPPPSTPPQQTCGGTQSGTCSNPAQQCLLCYGFYTYTCLEQCPPPF